MSEPTEPVSPAPHPPAFYRPVSEMMDDMLGAWKEANPTDATQRWHPGDAWWQIEQFAVGYFCGLADGVKVTR